MALSARHLITKPARVIRTPHDAASLGTILGVWAHPAWRHSGRRARLLRATTTARFATEFADLHATAPVFGPGLPQRTPDANVALTVSLDGELQDLELAALRSQATQTHGLIAAVGEDRYRSWWRVETFVAADDRAVRRTAVHNFTTSSPRMPRRRAAESTTTPQSPLTQHMDRRRSR